MLFGLKGKRWDERPYMNKYYNDSWKYPSKKPKNAEGVEGWCYGCAHQVREPSGKGNAT